MSTVEEVTEAKRVFKDSMRSSIKESAMLLDREQPNWYMDVNVGTLNMSSRWSCILGQIYGDYSKGTHQLDIDGGESGFDLPEEESDMAGRVINVDRFDEALQHLDPTTQYDLLQELWVERIKMRIKMRFENSSV